ncbi:MAG: 50S ribosomal protein L25 [Chloroflexi bacterium]|nr:50S ribosomal protein L25 [Chloroflexota bacterium]MBP8057036.1 50S ribosomal protein L25 [Chloroflexota bacterium]
MSERLTIAAAPRHVIGKQVSQLRRTGYIPAVIYGQNNPEPIQLENLALRRVLRHASTTHLIDLDLDGQIRTVLAREIQTHITRGDLVHVDFYEVNMKETITADAELILVGKSLPASKGDGHDVLLLHEVEIECLPGNLVSEIHVDASFIRDVDTVIYVKDLVAPTSVTILADPETPVARFEYESLAPDVDADVSIPAADAVEVIRKAKEDDEK